jgi:hypothetical protein
MLEGKRKEKRWEKEDGLNEGRDERKKEVDTKKERQIY